jgi:hypothetical protein
MHPLVIVPTDNEREHVGPLIDVLLTLDPACAS